MKEASALLVPALCLGLTGVAYAQSDAAPGAVEPSPAMPLTPQTGDAASQPSPKALDEIVVTATKRQVNARDLPASITALRGSDLEQRGYQSQEDFLKLVPGVTFYDDTITTNRITIRGIGADLNTSNTTGVFIGDVPFEDPILPRVTLDPNTFDLARVEILKGPQGTLFGGSALNGAVRYVPEEPLLGNWETKAFYQLEDVIEGGKGPTFGGALNLPIGQTAAVRLVGFDRKSPGWVDDLTRGIKNVNQTLQSGGRLMGLWQPGESWKISAMGIIQGTFAKDTSLTDNRNGVPSRDDTPQASPTQTYYDLETLGVQYSFNTFDVLSQTSRTYKHFNGVEDASRIGNVVTPPPPSLTITADNRSASFMEELRLTSNAGFNPDWKWLGGAFYRRVRISEIDDILASQLSLPLPSSLLGTLSDLIPGFTGYITPQGQINTTQSNASPIIVGESALFGETSITFWHRLEVTLGLRAFHTDSESDVYFAGVLAANKLVSSLSTQSLEAGSLKAEGLDPKFALKSGLSQR